MLNKRDFKKAVEEVGASIVNEMMAVYYNVDKTDREKIGNAVAKVLGATAAAKSNANHIFDKRVKEFGDVQEYTKAKALYFRALFKKIHADFNSEISVALKEFNKAVPKEVKEANKAAV